MSKGRVELGIGAGWYKEECERYGIRFPSYQERIYMHSEAVELIKFLWTNEDATFNGKYYKLKHATANPKPVQKTYPPILFARGGFAKGREKS